MNTQQTKGPLTQYATAKAYLERNKIPQMFESLIASLMMEKPENHFSYLDKQLNAIKEVGLENVDWETFVQHLHPTRDKVRLEHIQDEVSMKIRKEIEQQEDCDKPNETKKEEYEPDVFQLTETHDDY